MAHEAAKAHLRRATTRPERAQAVRAAFRLGMPLRDIEEYLDWLDAVGQPPQGPHSIRRPPQSGSAEGESTPPQRE
jgi:hypothetical protein